MILFKKKPKTVTFVKKTPSFYGLGGLNIETKQVKNPVPRKIMVSLYKDGYTRVLNEHGSLHCRVKDNFTCHPGKTIFYYI